jgi:hypothetical protein
MDWRKLEVGIRGKLGLGAGTRPDGRNGVQGFTVGQIQLCLTLVIGRGIQGPRIRRKPHGRGGPLWFQGIVVGLGISKIAGTGTIPVGMIGGGVLKLSQVLQVILIGRRFNRIAEGVGFRDLGILIPIGQVRIGREILFRGGPDRIVGFGIGQILRTVELGLKRERKGWGLGGVDGGLGREVRVDGRGFRGSGGEGQLRGRSAGNGAGGRLGGRPMIAAKVDPCGRRILGWLLGFGLIAAQPGGAAAGLFPLGRGSLNGVTGWSHRSGLGLGIDPNSPGGGVGFHGLGNRFVLVFHRGVLMSVLIVGRGGRLGFVGPGSFFEGKLRRGLLEGGVLRASRRDGNIQRAQVHRLGRGAKGLIKGLERRLVLGGNLRGVRGQIGQSLGGGWASRAERVGRLDSIGHGLAPAGTQGRTARRSAKGTIIGGGKRPRSRRSSSDFRSIGIGSAPNPRDSWRGGRSGGGGTGSWAVFWSRFRLRVLP